MFLMLLLIFRTSSAQHSMPVDNGATIVYSHRLIRPNSEYEIIAKSFQEEHESIVKMVIRTPKGELQAEAVSLGKGEQRKITIKVPSLPLSSTDNVQLLLDVAYKDTHGTLHEVKNFSQPLRFVQSSDIILTQLNKPLYKAGDSIQFRVLVLDQNLRLSRNVRNITAVLKSSSCIKFAFSSRMRMVNWWKQLDDIPSAYPNQPGYFNGTFSPLCNDLNLGSWTLTIITAVQTETKKFLVAKYQLPRFLILFNTPHYLTRTSSTLPIDVAVRDHTGNPVNGVLDVVIQDPSSRNKTLAPQSIELLKTPYKYELDHHALQRTFCQQGTDGYITLYVSAKESLTERVEKAEKRIPYHCDPFRISLGSSSDTYLLGLLSHVTVRFHNHDGSPLRDNRILSAAVFTATEYTSEFKNSTAVAEITDKTVDVENGMVQFALRASSGSKSVVIHANAGAVRKDLNIRPRYNNVAASIKVFGSKMHRVGATVQFQLECAQDCKKMYYAVVSKNGITDVTTVEMQNERSPILEFIVSEKMTPSATIIAYYSAYNEIASDAVEITVDRGSVIQDVDVTITPEDPRQPYVVPGFGNRAKVEITASPNSLIGLLAVDKSLLQHSSGHDLSAAEIVVTLAAMDSKVQSPEDFTGYCSTETLSESCSVEYLKSQFSAANLVVFVVDSMQNMQNVAPLPIDLKKSSPLRQDFRESFMFVTDFAKTDGKLVYYEVVPDSITTYEITAFAASYTRPIGLSKRPGELRVYQEIYVHMDAPPSMIVNETTTLNITLFNFRKKPFPHNLVFRANVRLNQDAIRTITVSVDLKVNQINALWHFPYTIGPFATKGTASITAELEEPGGAVLDRITRSIHVTQPGEPTVRTSSVFTLDASNPRMTIPIDRSLIPANIVPGSLNIKLIAFADTFATTMDQLAFPDTSKDFEGLIQVPTGCGEQNMARLMPNVFLARYMKKLGSRARNSSGTWEQLKSNMKKGFNNQANFRLKDGSYNTFGKSRQSGSTWLTAYVMRGFTLASEFIRIDRTRITLSINFLDKKQNPDGSFREDGHIIDRNLQGAGGQGDALTAFVLLAYIEAGVSNTATVKAGEYLERQFRKTSDPYVLGLTCYVLSRLASRVTPDCIRELNTLSFIPSDGQRCWLDKTSVQGKGRSFTAKDIETTAYALLALSNSSYQDVSPIVNWLLSQRNGQGGFKSTQDTIVALNALSELKPNNPARGVMQIQVGRKTEKLDTSSMNTKTFPVKSTSNEIEVKLAGTGTAKCQVEIQYNEKPTKPETTQSAPPTPGGATTTASTSEVDLTFTLYAEDAERKKLQIELCPSYNGSVDSGMIMVEIAAITGYTFDQRSAEDWITDGEFEKIECDTKCKLYFRKIDSGKSACLKMTLLRLSVTPDPSPRIISVYRCYEPEVKKIFYYSLAAIEEHVE